MPMPVLILFILRFTTLGANALKLKQFLFRFARALMSHDCDNDYHQQTHIHTDLRKQRVYVLNAHPINSSESTGNYTKRAKKNILNTYIYSSAFDCTYCRRTDKQQHTKNLPIKTQFFRFFFFYLFFLFCCFLLFSLHLFAIAFLHTFFLFDIALFCVFGAIIL